MTNDPPPIEVILTPRFFKVLKELQKKYPNISADLRPLTEQLEQAETPGDQIQGVGYTAYKVRLPNRDAQRGKSGGYRVIYYIKTAKRLILLTIYAKVSRVDIQPDEIRRMIDEYEHLD